VAASVGVTVVATLLVATLLRGRGQPPAPTLALPQAETMPPTTPSGGPDPSARLTVHAAGSVARPGVYVVAGGARVADVLTAAGGPTRDADVDQLNLATKVNDGDRVYVPRHGEAVPSPPGGATATPQAPKVVDVNAATAADLDALPGVGPALAQAIVEYRTRHGRFRRVDDLLDVPGIGPAKLAVLRPLVKV
jgi:competence protein ComEA